MCKNNYFCEACGDCLECYGDEKCYVTGGQHIYPKEFEQGRTKQMSALDLLLNLDESKIKKPTKEVEIKRLSEAAGEKVIFVCEAVPPGKMAEIQEMVLDVKTQQADVNEMQILTVLAGVKEPNLKSRELMDKFKAPTPKELLYKLLRSGEITNLYNVISELSGFGTNAVEEVKN